LDLAAVGEMPGDIGAGIVEHLALEEFAQTGLGLAPAPGLFLPRLLGGQAFLLLLAGAQCIGLGQVDLLPAARAGLARRLAGHPGGPLAGLATAGTGLAGLACCGLAGGGLFAIALALRPGR